MKTVYIVRHGETVGNVTNTWQGGDDPLNERGHEQARVVAERLRELPFDLLISSTMVRALETARAIAATTEKAIIESDLLREWKNPSSLIGQKHSVEPGTPMAEYLRYRTEYFDNPEKRFEDEETPTEVKQRARDALGYLASLEEERIVVVTHGNFLRICIGSVLLAEDLNAREFHSMLRGLEIVNTAISVIRHDGERWRVLTYNDHAHFAD